MERSPLQEPYAAIPGHHDCNFDATQFATAERFGQLTGLPTVFDGQRIRFLASRDTVHQSIDDIRAAAETCGLTLVR